MAFAGLWEAWRAPGGEVLRTYTIITTAANVTMAQLNERMPVILEPPDWPAWLGEAGGDPAALLRPAADGVLRMWPGSRAMNSVRNEIAGVATRSARHHLSEPRPHGVDCRPCDV